MNHFKGLWHLKENVSTVNRLFFHSGSVVVFSSVTTVSGTFVMWNKTSVNPQSSINLQFYHIFSCMHLSHCDHNVQCIHYTNPLLVLDIGIQVCRMLLGSSRARLIKKWCGISGICGKACVLTDMNSSMWSSIGGISDTGNIVLFLVTRKTYSYHITHLLLYFLYSAVKRCGTDKVYLSSSFWEHDFI